MFERSVIESGNEAADLPLSGSGRFDSPYRRSNQLRQLSIFIFHVEVYFYAFSNRPHEDFVLHCVSVALFLQRKPGATYATFSHARK